MKVSELIKKLECFKKVHGDLTVYVKDDQEFYDNVIVRYLVMDLVMDDEDEKMCCISCGYEYDEDEGR